MMVDKNDCSFPCQQIAELKIQSNNWLDRFNKVSSKLVKANETIESLKNCHNCMSQDGYDCRTCTRNDDPDEGKPLQDHWGLDR